MIGAAVCLTRKMKETDIPKAVVGPGEYSETSIRLDTAP